MLGKVERPKVERPKVERLSERSKEHRLQKLVERYDYMKKNGGGANPFVYQKYTEFFNKRESEKNAQLHILDNVKKMLENMDLDDENSQLKFDLENVNNAMKTIQKSI